MATERRTRATSVAATKAAEPPSRRTRAASVSANKRSEPVTRKATATPKRKRSASATVPRADEAADTAVAATPRRRAFGRQKRVKTGDEIEEVIESRGRTSERDGVEKEGVCLVPILTDEMERNDRRGRLEYYFPQAFTGAMNEHNLKFAVFTQDVRACIEHGLTEQEMEQLREVYSELDWQENHELKDVEREEGCATMEKMLEVGKLLNNMKTVEDRHNERVKAFVKDFEKVVAEGVTEEKKRTLQELCVELVIEERRLATKSMEELQTELRGLYCMTDEKLLEMGRKLAEMKTSEERAKEENTRRNSVSREKKLAQHKERKTAFVKAAHKAIGAGLSEERRTELQRMHQDLALKEKEFTEIEHGGELLDIGWRLEAEKTLEQRAREEQAKKTPVKRVKGAYFDTTAQGIVKAPLSARAHRTQQKHLFDENKKAGEVFEEFKASFADRLKFYEQGGTNIAMIKGYREMRYEIATLEEQHEQLQGERDDIGKIRSFTARVEGLMKKLEGMEKRNDEVIMEDTRKDIEEGGEVGMINEYVEEDGTVVRKGGEFEVRKDGELVVVFGDEDVETVAEAPSTAKKPSATAEGPKKTPRRKSIRMGALSLFTPGGTSEANSEEPDAKDAVPSSPLSSPPAVRDLSPAIATGNSSGRAPKTISWATPVSEIHDFLLAMSQTCSSTLSDEKPKNLAFDPRPIGFKCPGHRREWRGAEQTKELIIYRDWLNHIPNKDKEQLFGFFMTPREIGKAPTLESLKSLKDWKAWGAGLFTQTTKKGPARSLYIYDPEWTIADTDRMTKTGDLTKMQQLLVGAVKRCRGGCEEVVIEGRRGEGGGEEDSFARTAEWAAQVIRGDGLDMRVGLCGSPLKNLVIAK